MFLIATLCCSGFVRVELVAAQQDEVTEIVMRIWTDVKARQVRGKFSAYLDGKVKIESYDGKIISFPIESLVQGDKDYVDAVVKKFGVAPNSRTWSDTMGENFRGPFVKPDKSELEFLLIDDEKRMKIETIFLSAQDIEYLIQKINSENIASQSRDRSYRVWSYDDSSGNELRCIAQYKNVVGQNLVLNQLGSEYRIPLSRLHESEITYLISMDPSLRNQLSRLPDKSTDGTAGLYDENAKQKEADEVITIRPIWWISIGIVFLLLLVLIAVKYMSESADHEWDDD